MGAPSITKLEQVFSLGGIYKSVCGYMNGPASYTTAGDALLATDIGLTTIQYLVFVGCTDRLAIAVWAANDSPEKSVLVKIMSLAGVEVANASDQSTKKWRFFAIGLY